jgi:hypothetical protein
MNMEGVRCAEFRCFISLKTINTKSRIIVYNKLGRMTLALQRRAGFQYKYERHNLGFSYGSVPCYFVKGRYFI